VKGLDRAGVLGELGLVETPAENDPAHARHSVADLPERMAALSASGTAIACSFDERTMYSVVRGYTDGNAIWSIDHDGGTHGPSHLDIAGKPPAEPAMVRERLQAEQTKADAEGVGVDYIFNVPLDLSQALCGYKFDPERDDGPEFQPLDVVKTKRVGLFGKLFGKS
jgi:hypothetical protein